MGLSLNFRSKSFYNEYFSWFWGHRMKMAIVPIQWGLICLFHLGSSKVNLIYRVKGIFQPNKEESSFKN